MSNFTNLPIQPEQLPDFRQSALQPAAGRYPAYCMLKSSLFWLTVLCVSLLPPFLPDMDFPVGFWPAIAVGAIACWFLTIEWLDARSRGWALREHDLIYRHGVIWRRTIIMPFARIQHVESSNGPLERQFGLLRIKCFTAGGAKADLTVKGLTEADGNRVRQYLLEQIRDDTDAEATGALDAA